MEYRNSATLPEGELTAVWTRDDGPEGPAGPVTSAVYALDGKVIDPGFARVLIDQELTRMEAWGIAHLGVFRLG